MLELPGTAIESREVILAGRRGLWGAARPWWRNKEGLRRRREGGGEGGGGTLMMERRQGPSGAKMRLQERAAACARAGQCAVAPRHGGARCSTATCPRARGRRTSRGGERVVLEAGMRSLTGLGGPGLLFSTPTAAGRETAAVGDVPMLILVESKNNKRSTFFAPSVHKEVPTASRAWTVIRPHHTVAKS